MKKHKYDIILFFLFIAAVLICTVIMLTKRSAGAYAVVSVDNTVYGKYPLSNDVTVRIGNDRHGNTLVIENGCAYLTDVTCPDRLCEKQGKIKYNGQSIICLPNKTVVEIVSADNSAADFIIGG